MATVVGSERKEEKGTEAYSTASLPLGFQFNPTDEQLVFHYLRLKNEGRESEVQIIGEVDFYDHEPWDLPDLSVIKSDQREWFFFCRCWRDAKVPSRRNMATPAGYWKSTGKDRSIQSSRSSCDGLIGTKKTLVFYKGRAPKGTRTNWVMNEYSASATINYKGDLAEGTSPHQDAFVLCCVFKKLGTIEVDEEMLREATDQYLNKGTAAYSTESQPREEEKGTAAYSTESLPLGCLFRPTDELLVDHYLRLKNEGRGSKIQIIGEVDVYDYEPWDLPDLSVIKSDQREWFFFCRCRRDAKVPSRRNRATLAGYWKSTVKDRSIRSSRSSCDGLIGTKKTLVFYKGRAPYGTRTNWIMHEYSASATNYKGDLAAGTSPHQDDFVLCRLLQNEWLGDIKGEKIHHTGSSIITTNSSYIGVSDLASEAVLKDGLKDQEGSTMVSSPSVPSKRTRVLSGTQKFSCLVDGCKADLNMCKAFHRRHRVCERHSKIPVAIVGGIEQRFCHQCRRFHSLGEFDELKRSCRRRLAEHNMRRIKSQPLYPSSNQFVSNYKESIPKAFFAEEGIEKRITESQREVLGVEAFEMKSNSGEKNEEIEDVMQDPFHIMQDTFPPHHLFIEERFADTEDDKIFHTCSFADPSDLTVDPVQQSEGTSTEPIPHFPAEEGIEKRITSESQRMVFEVEAIDMKSNSGEKIGVEFEAFGQDKIEEIGIEPETSDMDRKTLSMGLEKCSDTIIQREVLQSCLMWGGLGLTEPPKDEDWNNAKKIYLMDNELSDLPKNPRSPVLSTLFLQRNYKLRMIPPSFFDYMPALQILNLSRTGIKSLPESIIRLVSLKRLFLNDCHRFMILSPKVGELKRLEVLDIEGTDIMDLPNEIKELTNLKCLEVSFCTYLSNGRRAMQSDVVVPGGIILQLSHLEELNLSMNPDDKRWHACVEDIVTEVCTLESLNTLKFYFPRVELVRYFLLNSPMWVHPSLSNFRFTVGYHVKRTMSRLPGDVEFELEQWERCLKYINGVAVPREIQKVLQYSTAFFLERHATIKKLSDFGIGNMKQLKCCVVGECNEVEVIIDATDVHEEDSEADALEEDSEADDHEEDDEVEAYREDGSNGIVPKTFGSKKIVLGSLEYLYIYYMKNLRRIWKGPVQPKCLSLLKSLTLRTCPQLTTIFTTGLLDNLYNLEELTVEDCPSIKTLVSCEISAEHKTSDFLPNLKRISLHYMPGLISISSGLHIAPRLEWLSFYNCPNLKHLLIEEVSSKDLKKIKGEWNWWVALKWRCGRPSYLDDIFVPINI